MSSSRTTEQLVSAYRTGAAVLLEAVDGMDATSLRARPIAGKLSSLEVLCHIVDSDQFMCDRIKRTIATERPLLVGVESADYPGPLSYHDRDPELLTLRDLMEHAVDHLEDHVARIAEKRAVLGV